MASLTFKFLTPLVLGRVSLSQNAGGDFCVNLFYYLQASTETYLVHSKCHGHLLTLTKGGNLILKAGKNGYDQLYFPDEDIETRTLFVLCSTLVEPKLVFHIIALLAKLINVKGIWARAINESSRMQRPKKLFT